MYLLPCMAESRFAESIPIKYTTNASGFQLSLWALIVIASNAPVYTRRSLLGADGPQAPSASAQLRSMHKPPVASADLSILGRDGTPGGPPLGERTTAAGSTTARLRVVSKCALSEISDKAHYPRRKIIREEERKASKIKAFSKNFSDYFLCFIMSVQR